MLLVALLALLPAPPAGKCVLDAAKALTPAQLGELEAICEDLDRSGAGQVEVAVVTSYEDVEDYATALFTRWRIGHRGKDDGLLVLLKVGPPGKRDVRVRTGYGLEGILPDGKVGAMIDQYAMPALREARWGDGLVPLTRALAEVVKRENAPEVAAARQRKKERLERERIDREGREDRAAGGGFAIFGALLAWLFWMALYRLFKIVPGRIAAAVATLLLVAGLATVVVNLHFFVALLVVYVVCAGIGAIFWFGGIAHRCPKCGGWMQSETVVLVEATYGHGGQERSVRRCLRCAYGHSDTTSTPMLSDDDGDSGSRDGWSSGDRGSGWSSGGGGTGSSGGGGGFSGGGGSTGGGGAGRSF